MEVLFPCVFLNNSCGAGFAEVPSISLGIVPRTHSSPGTLSAGPALATCRMGALLVPPPLTNFPPSYWPIAGEAEFLERHVFRKAQGGARAEEGGSSGAAVWVGGGGKDAIALLDSQSIVDRDYR